jgi:hypothetical protein
MLLKRKFWCRLGGKEGSTGAGLEWELVLGEMRALRVLLSLNSNLRAPGRKEELFLEREGRGLLVRVR